MAADAGVEVDLVVADVADDASVAGGFDEIFSRVGRVDHLVNNAGVGGNAVVEECSSELYLDVMNVNLCGVTRCTQAVLPQMRERGGSGTIINITSVVGCGSPSRPQSPYVASKWALEGISEELAQELAPFGIRVAIVEPGGHEVGDLREEHRRAELDRRVRDALSADVPDVRCRNGRGDRPVRGRPCEIERAIITDNPQLRYPVSWGGIEMAALQRPHRRR